MSPDYLYQHFYLGFTDDVEEFQAHLASIDVERGKLSKRVDECELM